jgi:nitrogen-specific signal transduction histidine kinase
VRFTIGDHGAGIPSEALDKVYSPFYTTKARGIGLGLPIARRAAFDHGGDIAIRTRPSGTEVSLWLPASGEEDEAS